MKLEFKVLPRRFLPRSIHKHRIFGGPLRGYRIVTSWHDYPAAITGRTERPLLDWFAQNVNPNETWLDIGAHYGYTAIGLCRLVGAAGRARFTTLLKENWNRLSMVMAFNIKRPLAWRGAFWRDQESYGLRQEAGGRNGINGGFPLTDEAVEVGFFHPKTDF
jgi:hypothetical protein